MHGGSPNGSAGGFAAGPPVHCSQPAQGGGANSDAQGDGGPHGGCNVYAECTDSEPGDRGATSP
jgi:hypothetical protein